MLYEVKTTLNNLLLHLSDFAIKVLILISRLTPCWKYFKVTLTIFLEVF